jgi:hypothetical protein
MRSPAGLHELTQSVLDVFTGSPSPPIAGLPGELCQYHPTCKRFRGRARIRIFIREGILVLGLAENGRT